MFAGESSGLDHTTTVTDGVAASRWYEPYGKPCGPKPANQPTTTGFLNQHEDTTGLTYRMSDTDGSNTFVYRPAGASADIAGLVVTVVDEAAG